MRRTAAISAVTSLLLGSAALAITGPATADQGPAELADAGNGVAGSAEASTHQRIVDYWTPARRASAIPREVTLPSDRTKPANPGKPGGGGSGGDTTGIVTGATWTDKAAPVAKTTGKVFFTLGTTRYVCSGSAVSGSANLVLTAGHCVWDDTKKFATNWIYYPGYDGGPSATYGTWTATSLFTTSTWAVLGGNAWPDDAGLAVVTDGGTGTLAARLGSLPAMAGQSGSNLAGKTFSAFGYPAAQKYHGQTLTYCQGPVQTAYDGTAATMSMACDMTGGSSGGPWYGAANGTGGQIVSVNSYGYQGLTRMFGPTFDPQESTMYGAANDGLCSPTEMCTAATTTQ